MPVVALPAGSRSQPPLIGCHTPTGSVERQKSAACKQQVDSAACKSRRNDRTEFDVPDIIIWPKRLATLGSRTLVQE